MYTFDDLKREYNFKVNERIVECRKKANIELSYLAESIGMSIEEYQDIENGNVEISVNTLKKICLALGITLKTFFETALYEMPLNTKRINKIDKFFDGPIGFTSTMLGMISSYLFFAKLTRNEELWPVFKAKGILSSFCGILAIVFTVIFLILCIYSIFKIFVPKK